MEEQTSDEDIPSTPTEPSRSDLQRTGYCLPRVAANTLRSLTHLCVRTLARAFGPDPLPIVEADPYKLQIHYDALDVDLPLATCYHVTNESFWKRVVLTKHFDKSLTIRRNTNWRHLGISLKYVEMVESSPVEYWPDVEMNELAVKIQDFVNEMHIKRLQSLKDRSFEKYLHPQTSSSEDDEEDISEGPESSVPTSEEDPIQFPFVPDDLKTESQLNLERQRAEEKAKRKKARQILREDKANARMEREAKRQRREARRLRKEPPPVIVKKKRRRQPKSFFEIEISDNEEDDITKIIDRRNKELFLNYKKSYNYPAEHCHHIDLTFVQHFKNLDTFTIEFLGPLQTRHYHHRHMNFSHDDIKRLSRGISALPNLRVFRLRNSRMDADKLLTLVRGLKNLPRLETVDFGFNRLQEDCANAFLELLENTSTIKNLELESNQMSAEVLNALGEALQLYQRGHLEYLGLSRNPLTDKALHAFISAIVGTEHIVALSLRGVKYLTEEGVICCIANELLGKHSVLRHLDMTAVPLTEEASKNVVKALDLNYKILSFDCLACGLDADAERDIAVVLKRNKYMDENPYVGDQTKTDEEIDEWLNRIKNPILLQVLAERENLSECPTNRYKEFMPLPEPSPQASRRETLRSEHSTSDSNIEEKPPKPVPQKPKLFIERPIVDPDEHNMYLKNFKEKFKVWNELKNVSLV